nr:EOG090X08PQ [Triops cancriformis]
MPKVKKFIDKKNAVTFSLVHRSQQDPLAADEKAPQRVLIPVSGKPEKLSIHSKKSTSNLDPLKRKEEQHKYGVYFDDEYNYLQHLREPDEGAEWVLEENPKGQRVWKAPPAKDETINMKVKLQLPSSVFPSEFEEEVGLLNKAAPHPGPRPDLDPDVVAALDDDFDYCDPDNELEDDFILKANAIGPEEDFDEEMGHEEDYGDLFDDSDGDSTKAERLDTLGAMRFGGRFSPVGFDDDEEETRSRFTEYSMSSSVMRRNDQLTLLDDRFEKLFETYDDPEIGALDGEEVEGVVQNSELLRLAENFEKELDSQRRLGEQVGRKGWGGENYEIPLGEDSSSSSSDEEEEENKEKWDCESILSTYSNIYNHPKLISEPGKPRIRVSGKTGIPLDVLGKPGLTKKFLDQLNEANVKARAQEDIEETESVLSTISTLSIRPKGETPEDRKFRKQALKDYRRERRIEKKSNTLAFKEEKKRQEKIVINSRVSTLGAKIV